MKKWLKSTAAFRLFTKVNERRIFSRSVALLDEWTAEDEKMFVFYRQFVRPGDLCFDVGANIGNRVKIFLKLGARVVAFEPQQDCQSVLEKKFAHESSFILVKSALGAQPGEAQLFRSDASQISTLSHEWIDAVKESGRFSSSRWEAAYVVPVTTLDAALSQHGRPAFIKVDVEGFEENVVAGLSSPVPGLSLEVTPEYLDRTIRCMQKLESLSPYHYNFSHDTGTFAHPEWLNAEAMIGALRAMRQNSPLASGDLYARQPGWQ